MIGRTIFKYRSATRKRENRDIGLRALVLSLLLIAISLHPKDSFSQPVPSSKSKVNVAPTAPDVDDNGDDNEDSADESSKAKTTSAEADDNAESDENLAAETAATQPTSTVAPTADPQPNQQTADEFTEANEEPPREEVVENPEPPIENQETLTTDQPPVETVPQESPATEIAPQPLPVPVADDVPLNQIPSAPDYVEVIPKEKNVEVEPRKDYGANYRERRTRHGLTFDFNAENLYFPDYTSIIDGTTYEDMFGQEDLTMLQASLSYKFNFALGALTAGFSYGQGTLVDDRSVDASEVPQERLLTISKTAVNVQWMLDTIMKEPYFVPYVGMSYWRLGLKEENATQGLVEEHDTGFGTSFTVGFLVQLNWLDKEAARVAYMEQGLENTYLDVFWTQYQDTGDDLDPILANDFNFGVGLRLEF